MRFSSRLADRPRTKRTGVCDAGQLQTGPRRTLPGTSFMPGSFAHTGRRSITKIYVDSGSSTENGRYNWGIPKETVSIRWHSSGKIDRITIGFADNNFFEATITSGSIPFPVHTAFLPIRLHQQLNEQIYLTEPVERMGKICPHPEHAY